MIDQNPFRQLIENLQKAQQQAEAPPTRWDRYEAWWQARGEWNRDRWVWAAYHPWTVGTALIALNLLVDPLLLWVQPHGDGAAFVFLITGMLFALLAFWRRYADRD